MSESVSNKMYERLAGRASTLARSAGTTREIAIARTNIQ
jgi:hypothetical protein